MAHGFINRGRNTSFVSRQTLAWHKIGKTVDAMTSAECMALAGLDFTVEQSELFGVVQDTVLTTEQSKEKPIVIRGQFGETKALKESFKVSNYFATLS